MKTGILILSVAILSMKTVTSFADEVTAQGKSLYSSRCASCHKLGTTLTGPDLIDVDKRRSMDWIIQFVKSSQALVKKGDKDAVEVFEKFNKIPMPDHQDLEETDIKNIIEYIKTEGANMPKEKVPFATPAVLQPDYNPISIHSYAFIASFLILVGALVAVLFFAVHVETLKKNVLNKNITTEIPPELNKI